MLLSGAGPLAQTVVQGNCLFKVMGQEWCESEAIFLTATGDSSPFMSVLQRRRFPLTLSTYVGHARQTRGAPSVTLVPSPTFPPSYETFR